MDSNSHGRIASLKRRAPWMLIVVFVVLPLYAVAIAAITRSNIFASNRGALTGDEQRAYWGFIGAGLTAAAALIGSFLVWNQHDASKKQQGLSTATSSIALLQNNSGDYATKSAVAGALATLVHLGHPVIAMRTLGAAWSDSAVDPRTGTWLIGEILEHGSAAAQVEAAAMFKSHAVELAIATGGETDLPIEILDHGWPKRLPEGARIDVFDGICEFMLSQSKAYWGGDYRWLAPLFEDAAKRDSSLRDEATKILNSLIGDVEPENLDRGYTLNSTFRSYRSMQKTIVKMRKKGGKIFTDQYTENLIDRVRKWT